MVEQLAFQQIGASLGDITCGVPTSGSFAYDPDQLRAIIAGWNDLAGSYQQSQRLTEAMTTVVGPGLDLASDHHAMDANSSGQSYRGALRRAEAYCRQQAARYQRSLDSMLDVDQHNASQVAKNADVPQGGGL